MVSSALILLTGLCAAPAQNPVAGRELYRVDFTKIVGPADDSADREKALNAKLTAMKGSVGNSADALLTALRLRDDLAAIRDRREFLGHLHFLFDTTFPEKTPEDNPEADAQDEFVTREVAAVPAQTLAGFISAQPDLKPFRGELADLRRTQSHRLSERDEATLAKLRPNLFEWEGKAFELFRSESTSPSSSQALHALTLIQLSMTLNTLARLRGFRDGVDAYCFELHLETAKVDSLLANLHSHRDISDGLSALKAKYQRKAFNVTFGLSEATTAVLQAVQPLGTEYESEMAALLDPKNGRIDIAGGPHRAGLGTGWAAPGLPSILYWPEFTGAYDDLDRGLSHEGGHAVHYALMEKGNVPDAGFSGPGYLFESFAELNQLLLADSLYRSATDPARKIFFLEKFLDKAVYPLYLAKFPDLEFSIHRAIDKGQVRTKDDFDRLEERVVSRWTPPANPLKQKLWMTNETFYTHPLYNINHMLGALLAVAYFQRLQADPLDFAPRYVRLLRDGFHDEPQVLLSKGLGIELGDPKLVSRSLDLVKVRMRELERLYQERK